MKTMAQMRQTDGSEDFAHLLQLLLEGGVLLFVGLEHLRDHADLRMHPRAGHESLAASVGDQGAHEGGIFPVAQGDVLVQDHRRVLLDGDRFPRQRGLLDFEVDALHQTHVGGDVVAGLQKNDVPHHEFPGGNRDLVPSPDDLGAGCGHLSQGGDGLFGLRFLNHPDHGVEDDDEHDGDGIDILAQEERNDRGDDQDDHEKIVELIQEEFEEPRPGLFGEFVGAMCSQAVIRLLMAETCFDMGLQFAENIVDRSVMALGIHDQGSSFMSIFLMKHRYSHTTESRPAHAGRHVAVSTTLTKKTSTWPLPGSRSRLSAVI